MGAFVVGPILAGLLAGPAGLTPVDPPALTLREAIAEALRASPELQPARDAIEVAAIQQELARSRDALKLAPAFRTGTDPAGFAQSQVGLALSKRLPLGGEVSFFADSTRYGTHGSELRDAGFTIGVAQPLLQAFGPAPRAELIAARRAVDGAERGLLEARQRLVIRVASAYYAIVREERLAGAATRALERARRLRDASEARARVGLATQLDVMRADLLVSQSEASAAAQQEALERARDELKVMLGRPLSLPLRLAEPDMMAEIEGEPPDESRAVADALSRRLDLREARERIDDARLAESVARWGLLPDVTMTASFTRRGIGGGPGARLLDAALGGWRVGVTTSYSLDRSQAQAAAAAAAVSSRAAVRALADLERAAAAEVRAALRALARSRAAIAIQRKALAIAERQLRLAELRYERGLADNFDVVDAEANLLQARSALIGAEVDCALARLALDRATGRLDPDEYLK